MSNWDLMMPGMGLTSIGLAGVVLAYAGIAETFIDGLHALSGLTMFVGLIFLAVGILDGGISTSNKAKATTLVVISIGLGFGVFGLTYNTSNYTITLAGILMGIAFPAIIIAYLAMKHPNIVKPIGSIVAMAGATGIIMWLAFGFAGPDPYIIPQQVEEVVIEETVDASKSVLPVGILAGSSVEGEPDYDPDTATVESGYVVEWTNADDQLHTVTSKADFGETFDSGLMNAGDTYTLDTSGLEIGTYEYFCTVHPWMTGILVVDAAGGTAPSEIVVIPIEAQTVSEGQIYYDPEDIEISAGTSITWENQDAALHTVTSGTVDEGPDKLFDSGIMAADEKFEYTFAESGEYDYYCVLHPWMTGTVSVT
ncbi:MAG: copper-binding protein [Nitrosopumilus sp. B06]|nr:MAG: copper-binding protein [Nitrosopumilus sp. B06]